MKFTSPLDNVRVASPCRADWNAMIGTDRVRFCQLCNLNVYNLSRMTRDEAEGLIATTEGRLCVRFYRRADGSIITSNCPVGLAAVRHRVSVMSRAIIASVVTFVSGVGFAQNISRFVQPAIQGGLVPPVIEPNNPREPEGVTGTLALSKPESFSVASGIVLSYLDKKDDPRSTTN